MSKPGEFLLIMFILFSRQKLELKVAADFRGNSVYFWVLDLLRYALCNPGVWTGEQVFCGNYRAFALLNF